MTKLKFELPRKNESVFLTEKFISCGPWLMDIKWLESCARTGSKETRMLVKPVLKLMQNTRTTRVIDLVSGNEIKHRDLSKLIPGKNELLGFEQVGVSSAAASVNIVDFCIDSVSFGFSDVNVTVDAAYFPMLGFDNNAKVFIRGGQGIHPIVMVKDGEVVGLLMPKRNPNA